MRIQNNIPSIRTLNNIKTASNKEAEDIKKLSSGFQINSAADDAAGATISEKMRAQIRGLMRASFNIQDGISMLDVADGAINETESMLHRIRELCVQAANDVNADEDRNAIDMEIKQLVEGIEGVSLSTRFNTHQILNTEKIVTNTITVPGEEIQGYVSSSALDSATVRARIQGITIYPNSQESIMNQMYADVNGYTRFTVTLDKFINAIDPNFTNFMQTGMYAADGTLSKANAAKFVNTVVKAMNDAFKAHDPTIPEIKGFWQDTPPNDRRMVLYMVDGTSFNIPSCPVNASNNTLGHGVLHMLFGNMATSGQPIVIGGNTDTEEFYEDFSAMIQAGADGVNPELVKINIPNMSAKRIGIDKAAATTRDEAIDTLDMCDSSLEYVNTARTQLGAYKNRLEHAHTQVGIVGENTTASESRIRDSDMAKYAMHQTKDNIILQVSTAMLAHGNNSGKIVLSLIS